jgi:hypothetical protein
MINSNMKNCIWKEENKQLARILPAIAMPFTAMYIYIRPSE